MSNLFNFPSSSYSYDFSASSLVKNEAANNLSSNAGLNFYVRDAEIMGLFGSEINSLYLDWVDVAIAVYVADRLSLREKEQYRNDWKRNFHLKIAVRNLETWLGQEVQTELREVLNYYTDDDWNFEFLPLNTFDRLNTVNNKLPLPPNNSPRVALFSGGLDSFAGVAQQLFNDKQSSFILVSGATNNRQDYQQRQQIKDLRKYYPSNEIIHHTIDFGFNWNGSEHPKEEKSQRTRGFVFTTLGAVTALNAGINVLEIYENGIGAINLPYDNSQVGTMNSRGVNPLSLLRMERFIEKLTRKLFQIKNLFLFQTKGEMCQHEAVKTLAETIPLTFSCDGFPVREAQKPQCGVCTSCLLRRVSLETAEIMEVDMKNHYGTDFSSLSSNPSFAQLNDLRAMEWQYQTLKSCLAEEESWHALVTEYPILQTIVSELATHENLQDEDIKNRILLLYSQYCAEWKTFSARQNYINLKTKAA
jgi:7-cyano-7-deazaguanine synthase in queuosine biosynthesis